MSSDNEPVVTTDSPLPPPAEAPVAAEDPVQSTSEANIAATDPNVESTASLAPVETKPVTDSDLDMKAADIAEGATSGAAVVAPDASEETVPAPSPSKKSNSQKRRSSGVVPEHKSKKLNRKKSMPTLHLEAKPGEYYFARLKGHQAWPAIICDEDMLPESLLASRPVTAARPDGTYREDFQEGGKNVKDRTYPVMFLYTNEFAWLPNVDLSELDVDKIKDEPQGKKGKKLYEAYKIAAEEHELEHFKKMLSEFEMERQRLEAEMEEELAKQEAKQAAKAAEKAAKKEAKSKRKSKAATDEDVDMEDADAAPKSSSKKRKKAAAVEDGDEEKPAKTPKTLKVNLSKAANGESSKGKPKSKPKPVPQEPPMTEEEKLEKKQKSVLYLRHRLQKGFLQESAPAESEMSTMAANFDTLEQYQMLEAHVIKNTKIHKVLKAIIKLDNVPMDDKYKFKERSHKLLQGWNKILADGVETGTSAVKDADTTNGIGSDDKQNGDSADETKAEEKVEVNDAAAEEPTVEDAPAPALGPQAGVTEEPPAAPVEVAPVEVTLPVNEPNVTAVETKSDVDANVSTTEAKDAPVPVTLADTTADAGGSAEGSANL